MKQGHSTVYGVPNLGLLILTVGVVVLMLLLVDVSTKLEPIPILFVLSFSGYMLWMFQLVIVRRGRIISLFPFRLKRTVINFEEIERISFTEDTFRPFARSAINYSYLQATVKAVGGKQIRFTEIGLSNFSSFVNAIPLNEKATKELAYLQKKQAEYNFMRIGNIMPAAYQLLILFMLYNYICGWEIFFITLGVVVILRLMLEQTIYRCRIDKPMDNLVCKLQKTLIYATVICGVTIIIRLINGLI